MPHFTNLADAADYLGGLADVMETYDRYDTAAQGWFYAFNPGLSGAAPRPGRFASWEHWHQFTPNQRAHLCRQAGLNSNAIGETNQVLDVLRDHWNRWNPAYCVVNWTTNGAEGATCNVFLGECLYLCGYEHQATLGGKYLSSQSYWFNHNGFVQPVAKKPENIKRGLILSYRSEAGVCHVEVITSAAQHERYLGLFPASDANSFASRGGGRGGDDGSEKQGQEARRLNSDKVKILRLIH